jgi:hypothetical protein
MRAKKLIVHLESVREEGIPFPKHYFAYFTVINMDDSTKPIWALKNAIVKRLFSLAEFVGQW